MPYVPSFERYMKEDAYLRGIKTVLKVRFGQDGETLLEQAREIADYKKLENLLSDLESISTQEEVRQRIEYYKALPKTPRGE